MCRIIIFFFLIAYTVTGYCQRDSVRFNGCVRTQSGDRIQKKISCLVYINDNKENSKTFYSDSNGQFNFTLFVDTSDFISIHVGRVKEILFENANCPDISIVKHFFTGTQRIGVSKTEPNKFVLYAKEGTRDNYSFPFLYKSVSIYPSNYDSLSFAEEMCYLANSILYEYPKEKDPISVCIESNSVKIVKKSLAKKRVELIMSYLEQAGVKTDMVKISYISSNADFVKEGYNGRIKFELNNKSKHDFRN